MSLIVFGPIVVLCVVWGLWGCEQRTFDTPEVQKKISSFEHIEQEINNVRKEVQFPAAKDRIYHDLFHERNEILKIAEGRSLSNLSPTQKEAIIRKLAWVVLGELQERRPEFEIIVEEEDRPSVENDVENDLGRKE